MESKKEKTILGNSIWKIFFYFIIYSFFGYIIETIFGIVTTGRFESRQSFLYGPFLGIYGIAGVILIIFIKYFKQNNLTIFVAGFIIGSLTEYIISYVTDIFLHTQWWDYSDKILNINGRICLLYSVFWGILTVFLVKVINPKIDKIYDKIISRFNKRSIKICLSILIAFLAIDCALTAYAQEKFIIRMVVENDINVENLEEYKKEYEKTYNNKIILKIINTLWNNKKMIKTFPNIKIEDIQGNTIYLNTLLPEIKPYYIKFFDKIPISDTSPNW